MSVTLSRNDYAILDKNDENQIISSSDEIKQALVYDLKGKKQITFIGLKWLTVRMSQAGQALEIVDSSVKLEKDGEDKELWFWRSSVKVRNQKTGLETEGIAECPYLETNYIYKDGKRTDETESKYDSFGRTKAHSKAERNAWRKQIPELEITTLLKSVQADQVEVIKDGKKACECKEPKKSMTSQICLKCGGT